MSRGNRIDPLCSLLRLAAIALAVSGSACSSENGLGLGIPSGAVGPGRLAGAVLRGNVGVEGIRVAVIGRDSTTTDAAGEFIFPDLPPSYYTLTIRLPRGEVLESGQSAIRNANVGSGKTTRVEWRLNTGAHGSP